MFLHCVKGENRFDAGSACSCIVSKARNNVMQAVIINFHVNKENKATLSP